MKGGVERAASLVTAGALISFAGSPLETDSPWTQSFEASAPIVLFVETSATNLTQIDIDAIIGTAVADVFFADCPPLKDIPPSPLLEPGAAKVAVLPEQQEAI